MSKDKREHAAGKGDRGRPVDKEEFDKNHSRIWPEKKRKEEK